MLLLFSVKDTGVGTASTDSSSSGAVIVSTNNTATSTYEGTIKFVKITGNTWVYDRTVNSVNAPGPNEELLTGVGYKTLASTLDRIAVVPLSGGANPMTQGTFNILYE